MQPITPASLDAAFYSFDLSFQGAYERTETWFEKVASVRPSTGKETHYGWMKVLPRFREWVGPRTVHALASRGYVLANKKFELTAAVERTDIEDDQIGLYSDTFALWGESAKKWPDDTLAGIIQAGATNLCFDGQPFFSASHPIDVDNPASATYSNLNASGMALNAANYTTVRAAMRGYVADDNHPLKINPNLLIVPPQLEEQANQILNAEFIAPTTGFGQNAGSVMQTNTLKGTAQVVVIEEFANQATTWYLADVRKPLKPFVWQLRESPDFVALTDSSTKNVFDLDQFLYGSKARGAGGYSLPFLCVKSVA